MKISRIRILNYRGIAALDREISPSGLEVRGANGRGKSSVLNALHAALKGRDIGPDAIRLGEDHAEITVDMDNVSVQRVINQARTSLTVTTREGMAARKPQDFLKELLGTSSLDPLDLLLEEPKKRRARVLEALPLTITADELRVYAPDLGDVDTSGHGLEVIARVEADYRAQRVAATHRRDAAKAELERLNAAAAEAAAAVPPPLGRPPMSVAGATESLAACRDKFSKLVAEDAAARRAEERTTGARDRLVTARKRAEGLRERAAAFRAAEPRLIELRAAVTASAARVAALEAQLAEEKAALLTERDDVAAIESDLIAATRTDDEAAAAETMVRDLEGLIAETVSPPIPVEELAAAQAAVQVATEALERAHAVDAHAEALRAFHAATAEHDEAAAERANLDAIVKALQQDAPAALLAGGNGIPGLGLDGNEITLDGVRLDALCGAEAMRFCVDVSKRLNAKSKILIVDGLERIDPDAQDAFKRHAVAGGFQLFASCVDRGETVFEAIEPDDVAA